MTNSVLFSLGQDIQGFVANALQFTTENFTAILQPNVETGILVPSNFNIWVAVFSITAGSHIWTALNAIASIPVGNSLVKSNSQLLDFNARRTVYAGDIISVITNAGTPNISISLYAVS